MAKARKGGHHGSHAEGADDELATSLVGTALMCEPGARDTIQVQQALDWWLESLPASGAELAQELRAPSSVLFEAFRRGRLAVFPKGYRLQDEGDEVRNYSIILLGRCRLRCRVPAPKGEADEEEEQVAAFVDSDGCVAYETVGRGEALGMAPSESRSQCDVHCLERTTFLLLSPDDYAATLRPYHRELQAQAVEFLQRHGVCPHGTAPQLQRLVCAFRHRRAPRGTVVMHAGEHQRSVWILRQGSCSVLADGDEQQPSVEDEEATEASEDSEDEDTRLERMRALPSDSMIQQAAAAEDWRRGTVSKYARPFMQRQLEARRERSTSIRSRSAGPAVSAVLCEPGLLLGEEALLYDARHQVTARCWTTVRADEECHFYVADVTTFRQLLMYIGIDNITERVSMKFLRRNSLNGRNSKVAKSLIKQAQQLKRAEMRKEDRQRIRLPASVGFKGVEVLDDVNDYLRVVFDHRKAPRNDKTPATLCVLEGLGLNPKNINGTSSRGVGAMLKLYDNPSALKKYRMEMEVSGLPGRRKSCANLNPMGENVPAGANYEETVPPTQLALEPPPAADGSVASSIFFRTEPELDETEQPKLRSSSVPVLPRLAEPTQSPEQTIYRKPLALPRRSNSHSRVTANPAAEAERRAAEKEKAEKASAPINPNRAAAKLMKAFHRVIPGKSILVLTDRGDVRKSVMKALMSAATEVVLVFVKTTSELWHRLRDRKEKHHALILDLSKTELEVGSLLKCCKAHARYGNMPIIVLSASRDLPEVVRTNCSFVVFHPLAASMLREALVWCFDRKFLLTNSQDMQEPSIYDAGAKSQKMLKDLEVQALNLSITAAPAIAVS